MFKRRLKSCIGIERECWSGRRCFGMISVELIMDLRCVIEITLIWSHKVIPYLVGALDKNLIWSIYTKIRILIFSKMITKLSCWWKSYPHLFNLTYGDGEATSIILLKEVFWLVKYMMMGAIMRLMYPLYISKHHKRSTTYDTS